MISSMIDVLVTAFEHCARHSGLSCAAAPNQCARAMARLIGMANDASETAIALVQLHHNDILWYRELSLGPYIGRVII